MSMIERVAAAMHVVEYGTEYQDGTPVVASPHEMDILRLCARAAITAMREPTPEMWSAVRRADWEAGYDSHHQHPQYASMEVRWRAMIDAALKE